VEPLLVASIRERIPIISERGHLYERLSTYLDEHGVHGSQPDLLLLHSRHELQDEGMSIDVEVAMPLPTALPGNEQVSIRTLPSGLMACTVHTGDDLSLGRAYLALHRWMGRHWVQFRWPSAPGASPACGAYGPGPLRHRSAISGERPYS